MTVFLIFLITQNFNFEYREVPDFNVALEDSLHSFDVRHYLINVESPMTSRYISGCVTVACRSNQANLLQVDLQLDGLNVDSVRVDGVTATYTYALDTIRVNLPTPMNQGDSFAVMVGYSGTASGQLGYLWYQSVHTIAYSLGCPYSTKCWMPCYDNLLDKADNGCEMYITVPDSFTVCATGAYLGKTVNQGKATYHWKHGYPISPYLIHFAASIFRTYSDWYRPATGDSVEIKYFFWPRDTIYAPGAFSLTTDMMAFFDSLYGPFPFERYGMDVLYPFYYGGMEHQTTSSIIRSWITSGPDYYGMAHEMSHQWWGDMVTCYGWRDVWLNEGFGTYCDALYQGHREGQTAFLNTMVVRRGNYLSAEDANPHSIYDPPENLLYEWGHSYCKGSWILHMIRFLSGSDSTWLHLMSVYRDSFAYKNASSDDLNRLMNRELGADYGWFFQEWVYLLGYPRYHVTWNKIFETPDWRLVLDVGQTQTIGPPVFHMPLPIGVNYSGGDTILTLGISQSPQHFEYLLPQEPMTITVDPEKWVIQRNTVTGVGEGSAGTGIRPEGLSTLGRAIRIRLQTERLIKVFDALGREVFRTVGQKMDFRPASAGIYYVLVDQDPRKYVIVK